MERVSDLSDSISDSLRRLEWHPYLVAMSTLGGELRSLYADMLVAEDPELIEATLDLVHDPVRLECDATVVSRAADVADRWSQLYDERSEQVRQKVIQGELVPEGLVGIWYTFAALAEEIAGISEHYFAGEWVADTAVDRWRYLRAAGGPKATLMDSSEGTETEDRTVRVLRKFQQIIKTRHAYRANPLGHVHEVWS